MCHSTKGLFLCEFCFNQQLFFIENLVYRKKLFFFHLQIIVISISMCYLSHVYHVSEAKCQRVKCEYLKISEVK